jgi:hypothetical protein
MVFQFFMLLLPFSFSSFTSFFFFFLLLPTTPHRWARSEREREEAHFFKLCGSPEPNVSPHVRRTRWRVDESLHQVPPI